MLKIDEIEGRIEDVIIAKDGRKMVRFHAIFIDIEHLRVAQVIQVSLNKIQFNLVVESAFDKDNEQIISKRLKSQIGEMAVLFIYLNEIPKSKNGKFKAVISNLKNQEK